MRMIVLAFQLLFADAAAPPPPVSDAAARLSQQVGLTDVDVEYESVAVKGGRPAWDRAATLRFSREVQIAGKAVPAGKYRLSATPGKHEWTLALAPASEAKPGAEPVLRIKLTPKAVAPARARLTFLFADWTDDKATLDLEWDKVRIGIPIATRTEAQLKAERAELDAAWLSYANAARYMLETEKDFDAGLRYVDRSLALKEDWYTLWIKAALLAAKHDYRAAVAQGERAYALGQQQGDKFVLAPELETALADWRVRGR